MKSPGRRDEREQRPGDDAGRRERQRHAQEGLRRARVQVLRRLEQPRVDLLERDVERQRHEGQEVVGDARDDRERRREQALAVVEDVDVLQEADDWALVREDVQPRERPDQVRDEERRDDREQEQVPPRARAERDPVHERVREQQRDDGRDARVQERAEELLAVVRERLREVRELPRELEVREDPRLQRLVPEEAERDQEEQPEPERAPARAAGTASAADGGGRTSTPRWRSVPVDGARRAEAHRPMGTRLRASARGGRWGTMVPPTTHCPRTPATA